MNKSKLFAGLVMILGIAGSVGGYLEAINSPVTRDEFDDMSKRIKALEDSEEA